MRLCVCAIEVLTKLPRWCQHNAKMVSCLHLLPITATCMFVLVYIASILASVFQELSLDSRQDQHYTFCRGGMMPTGACGRAGGRVLAE